MGWILYAISQEDTLELTVTKNKPIEIEDRFRSKQIWHNKIVPLAEVRLRRENSNKNFFDVDST